MLTAGPASLLIGSTVLLGAGALAAGLARAPVHRQRVAELAVSGTLVWLLLALVPLPRWPRTSVVELARETMERPDLVSSNRFANNAPLNSTPALGTERARAAELAAETSHSVPGLSHCRNAGRPDLIEWRGARILALLQLAYGAGSAVLIAYLLLGGLLVHRLLARSTDSPVWLTALFAARCRARGVRRARLRVASRPCRPFLAGIIVPTVVIPRALAEPEREAELCHIFDHELIHLERGDVLSRILFALAMPVLWPNPLFWYLRACAALSAELIADDAAAGAADRQAYTRALLSVSEQLQSVPIPVIMPGAFRNRSELTRRIEMLTSNQPRLAMTCTRKLRVVQVTATLLTVGTCAAVFGARSLPAQPSLLRTNEVDQSVVDRASAAQPDNKSIAARGEEFYQRPQTVPMRATVATLSSSDSRDVERDVQPVSQNMMPMTPDHDATALTPQGKEPDPVYAATLALVDRALTLRNDVELARASLADYEQEVASGRPLDAGRLKREQIATQMLQRRLNAVLILVQAEIAATQIEVSAFEEAVKLGNTDLFMARAQLARLNGRLKVLQTAL
jgi:beta-lactamase regulating signal transducer with metallopeptidase domain